MPRRVCARTEPVDKRGMLYGMREISDYMRLSPKAVRRLIAIAGFPAFINNTLHRWTTSTYVIDDWILAQAEHQNQQIKSKKKE